MEEPNPSAHRNWDIACHLAALALFLAIPFANILGPLVVWLWKRKEFPSVDYHGKESLNFQISISVYAILAGLLMFVLVGYILMPLIMIANIIFIIVAAVKTSDGQAYRYPFTIRLIQ